MIKQFIKIITDFQAIHNWPECPISAVDFLRHPHRHKIIITVQIETTKDRQLEFFMFKELIDKIIIDLFGIESTKQLGRMSMEELSRKILNELREKHGFTKQYIEVEASEDGQVSGISTYYHQPKSE